MLYDVYRMKLEGVALPVKEVMSRGPVRGVLHVHWTAHKGKYREEAHLIDGKYQNLIQYLFVSVKRDHPTKPGVLILIGEEFKNATPVLANWATWAQEWRCVPVRE